MTPPTDPVTPELVRAIGDQFMRFGVWAFGLAAWFIFWRWGPWGSRKGRE